jgi:hypothetical protein
MARTPRVVSSLKLFTQRSFWSFQVVHTLLGGALTVGGAVGALTIGDGLQRSITGVDGRIAEIQERLESINSTLVQFRVVQSNGVILGALASGDGLRDEYREPFVKLMFTLRRTPAMSLIREIYPADLANFNKERDELDRLQTAAMAEDRTLKSWDDFLAFEMTREMQVMDLQSRLLQEKYDLQSRRQGLQVSLDTATTAGFVVQQIGFVVILLAGLIYQHVRGRVGHDRDPPPPQLG